MYLSSVSRCSSVSFGSGVQAPLYVTLEQDDSVPVIVGSITCMVSILVVIGYAVYRSWFVRRVDYDTMGWDLFGRGFTSLSYSRMPFFTSSNYRQVFQIEFSNDIITAFAIYYPLMSLLSVICNSSLKSLQWLSFAFVSDWVLLWFDFLSDQTIGKFFLNWIPMQLWFTRSEH